MSLTAIVELSFDPLATLGGITLRWDALALVGVLLVAIGTWVIRLHQALGDHLRFDDVCFVLLGAVPGAVVGGRLVHVIGYPDRYLALPLTALDLGVGSASLVGAVVGGALSAAYICRLLGGSIGLWADAAAVPVLLAIGLGKLALMLGGAGQGVGTDGALGVAFVADGPWRSIDAATPAWPSQVLEGAWALLGIPVVLVVEQSIVSSGRAGRGIALLFALAWWLAGRAVVALSWRDEPLLGLLGPAAVATLVALAVVLIALVITWRSTGTAAGHRTAPQGPSPAGTGDR